MTDVPGRPDWSALRDMMGDLRKATADLPNLQRRMMGVTGTGWSADGSIKAVVGPRGHLMDLDIDPRVLRRPDARALSAMIVAAVRAAVEDAGRQSAELMEGSLPRDLRSVAVGGTALRTWVSSHDADVREKDGDDE